MGLGVVAMSGADPGSLSSRYPASASCLVAVKAAPSSSRVRPTLRYLHGVGMSLRRTIGTTAAIAVALAGNVVTAMPALAAEGSSTLRAGCTYAADDAYLSASGLDPLSYDGAHNDGAVVPLDQSLEVRSATSGRDDCGVDLEHGTSLLVGSGSTGLTAGSPVRLVATIHLKSSQITNTITDDFSTFALADVAGRFDIVDPDSQVCVGEYCSFGRFMSFDARSTRDEYAGADRAEASYSYEYESDLVTEVEDFGDTNLPAIDVQVPFTALVGSTLNVQGRLSELATSSVNASAVADVATGDYGFDLDISPAVGYTGLALELGASEGGPQDTTPPTLTLPDDITAVATSADGAVVEYVVSAVDETDADPSVSCSPESGSSFQIGTSPVDCTAVDSSGNVATGSFNVTVSPPAVATPAQQINTLIGVVDSYGLEPGQTRALRAKLETALNALTTGETTVATNALEAFVRHAQAQSGTKLTADQSTELVNAARAIQDGLHP